MGTLLLGNGLNRCLEGFPSWDSLLTDVSNEFFCNVGDEDEPLLKYDMLLCQAKSEYGHDDVKSKLMGLLASLNRPGLNSEDLDFIAAVQECGLKTILTTNFDYNLEEAFERSQSSSQAGKKRVLKYSNEVRKSNIRRNEIGDITIHHIHGELDFPQSICLGMTRYVENLSRIRELLSCSKEDKDGKVYQLPIDEAIFAEEKRSRKTWAELFLNDDVYIVGLGLTSSELDLWWLLIRRAQLMARGDEKTCPNNRIVYFPLIPEGEASFNSARFDVLHVETKHFIVANNDWRGAYRRIWDCISSMETTNARKTAVDVCQN